MTCDYCGKNRKDTTTYRITTRDKQYHKALCNYCLSSYLSQLGVYELAKADAPIDSYFIEFDVHWVTDAVGLLLANGVDIHEEIMEQLKQGDPVLEDNVLPSLQHIATEKSLDGNKLTERFMNDSMEEIMRYIIYKEDEIKFNYAEAGMLDDRAHIPFIIPCLFDARRYINDVFNIKI